MGEVLMIDEIILDKSETVENTGYSEDVYVEEYSDYREAALGKIEENQSIEENPEELEEDQKSEEIDESILLLNDIKNELGDIKDDLRNNQKVGMDDSRSGISSEYVSDNSIISVSSNIIDTPLNEYTISESILTLIFVGLFVAGMALVIKRSLFKWK